MNIKDLLMTMATSLVDHPDDVEVNVVEAESSIVLELKVNPDDIGKVIGKEGKTAKAMRTILSASASKLNKRSILEILE